MRWSARHDDRPDPDRFNASAGFAGARSNANALRRLIDADIDAAFEVMHQLRPHLKRDDYVPLVRQLERQHFQLVAALDDGTVRAVAGYASWTCCTAVGSWPSTTSYRRARPIPRERTALLDWLKATARQHGCIEVRLISRVTGEDAHRFYLRESFGIEAFHFRAKLD